VTKTTSNDDGATPELDTGDGPADARAIADRLAETLEHVGDAIYTLDRSWRFTYLNGEAERLVRRSSDELLGRVVWEEFPEAARSPLHDLYRRALEHGEPVGIDRYPYPPLDTTFEISARPTAWGLVVRFRDVQEHLDRERHLAARAEDEQRAASRLRELDDTKNAFLSAVSHELRSPLTVVRGLANELVSHGDDLEVEERREIHTELLDQAERLERLLADLLDVDRLQRGALRSKQSLTDVVASVRSVLEHQPVADRVRLEAPDELKATVDRGQFERIVANLIGNAAKYAPQGPITVRLEPVGPGVRLEVLDEGPGIPEDERERVFEPLYRMDDEHPRPGTGIGLSLVAAFAELHGGDARVVPNDRGAHLQVDLPGDATD
jgi:signal transduction histidine kinase